MAVRKQEIALLTAVVLIAALALLPAVGPRGCERDSETSAAATSQPTTDIDDTSGDASTSTEIDTMDMRADAPSKGVFHDFFPLEVGAVWHYRVNGPSSLVPGGVWSMKVVSAPTDEAPGKMAVGFGGVLVEREIVRDGDVLRFGFLPLCEPLEHLGNQPTAISGETLPEPSRVAKGAAWNAVFERLLPYRYRDNRGRPVEKQSKGRQLDYARIDEFEDVTVPAGRFHAFRVEWSSRLELEVEKRQVLDPLTAKAFREETMWLAPGIGLVRRFVTYPGYRGAKASFDLLRYDAPAR